MIQMKKECLSGAFVPKSLDSAERTIDVVWSTGAQVRRSHQDYGQFYEELSLDPKHVRLDRLQNGAPVLNNHNDAKLFDQIGVVTRASVENGQGTATIKFSDREDVAPIFKDVSEGIFRNISVGYKIYKAEEIEQENDHPILRSLDTEFFEISLVPINADAGAQVRQDTDRHSLEIVTRKETAMPNKPNPSINEPKSSKKAPPIESNSPPNGKRGSDKTISDVLTNERQRIRMIEDRCQTHSMSAEFTRKLIDDGLSESESNKLILDELTKRSLDNMIHNQRMPRIEAGGLDEIETRRESIKNGILFSVNPNLVPKDKLHEKVHIYSRKSIPAIIGMELESRGEKISHLSADQLVSRSFHSTSDFPLIMGMASEAAIKQSYLNLVKQQTFRPLVRYDNAKNFLPMRKLQMGELPNLERVPEGAEVTFGSVSEHAEQWAIVKYAKGFQATYELMVNDQKNLIFSAMTMYGAAAANTESNIVWSIFKNNPMTYKIDKGLHSKPNGRWFDKKHHNVSGPSALSHDSLEEAEYMMSVQKGHDGVEGHELNIMARYLIIPSRLKNTAKRLLYSQYNPTQVQDVNLYQNAFSVIAEARLNPEPGEKSQYPWYLACDPSVLPVIWMAYLNGIQEPRIMYQTDFDTLSVKVRADLDFGVTHGEWKAVHRNEGTTLEKQKLENNFHVPEGGSQ